MTPNQAASALAQVGEDVLAARVESQPFLGTLMGVPGAPTVALQDLTLDGQAATRGRMDELRSRVDAIPTDSLTDTERTSRDILGVLLRDEIESIDLRTAEMTIDAFFGGPQALLLMALPKVPIRDTQAAADYLDRLRAVPTFLAGAAERLRQGATTGRTATRLGAAAAIAQARTVADSPAEGHVFGLPIVAAQAGDVDLPDDIDIQLKDVLLGVVGPAMRAFADAVESDVLPAARGDEEVGLCHLEDGAQLYRSFLRTYTTAEVAPEEIHQIGLRVIAELDAEYAELGPQLFGTDQRDEIFSRLRDDPALRFDDADELVALTRECVVRAEGVAPDWFDELPAKPCIVSPMPAAAAAGMTAAYYQPPQGPEGPRGVYWINTTGPVLTRYEAECVAFHEAIPGHHTQLALQAQLDLPRFRQVGLVLSGYAEGWGLYVERLSDEMGLYSSDLARMGMLAADSMRACRLVIDTGLHHFGWSRQQGLDYMLANAPISEEFARAEVDRYCVLPGQACSYMLGRHEIERLRRLARDTLGEAFDIKAFHHVVLKDGQVPLSTLAANVQRWLGAAQAAAVT